MVNPVGNKLRSLRMQLPAFSTFVSSALYVQSSTAFHLTQNTDGFFNQCRPAWSKTNPITEKFDVMKFCDFARKKIPLQSEIEKKETMKVYNVNPSLK